MISDTSWAEVSQVTVAQEAEVKEKSPHKRRLATISSEGEGLELPYIRLYYFPRQTDKRKEKKNTTNPLLLSRSPVLSSRAES